MGWTFLHRERGQSATEFFRHEFAGGSGTVIDTASKNVTVYAVYEIPADKAPDYVADENGKVRIGFVILTKWNSKDHHNFGYKDMDESMGPCESDCPARILNQLSPFKDESKHEYAADWRKRCRANLEKTALKLRDGMTVKLPEPLTFTDGSKLDTFTVRKNGRKFRFYNGGMPYRITCWNKRGLTEVTASADVE